MKMKKLITILSLGLFSTAFAQSTYYNDYRKSITDLNWETVAANLLLTNQQKADLFALNNQYSDYNSWNIVYANNPDQWRTDRYTSIQKIMGTEKYTQFKNKYYKGQNPVAVYNRNKNNYKSSQSKKYKSIQAKKNTQNTKSMSDYNRKKQIGDGSHLHVKGSNGKNKK